MRLFGLVFNILSGLLVDHMKNSHKQNLLDLGVYILIIFITHIEHCNTLHIVIVVFQSMTFHNTRKTSIYYLLLTCIHLIYFESFIFHFFLVVSYILIYHQTNFYANSKINKVLRQ